MHEIKLFENVFTIAIKRETVWIFSIISIWTFYLHYYSSYSYDTVQVDAEKLWRFQRYTVIYDYIGRIPSPINLIIRFRQLVKYLYSKCKSKYCCTYILLPEWYSYCAVIFKEWIQYWFVLYDIIRVGTVYTL